MNDLAFTSPRKVEKKSLHPNNANKKEKDSPQHESQPQHHQPQQSVSVSHHHIPIDDSIYSDFDPLLEESEIVELGLSHEIINDELYLPSHPSRDWIHCYISTTGPGCYRMYLEGKKKVRFLLSAKQFSTSINSNSSFYISSNEDFPTLDSIPKAGYLARLDKQRDDSFLITLNSCHLCDNHLGLYHCGRRCNHTNTNSKQSPPEREVIARIYHYFRTFRPTNLEYRCINVQVPLISKAGKRKIWCPRAFQRANPNISNDIDVNTAITLYKDISFKFENSKPEWNEKAKSLVVKFQGNNRVLIPSTRNFLLCSSWNTSLMMENESDDDENDPENETINSENHPHSIHENEIAPAAAFDRSNDCNDDNQSIKTHSSSQSSSTNRSYTTNGTQPIMIGSPLVPQRQHSGSFSPCSPVAAKSGYNSTATTPHKESGGASSNYNGHGPYLSGYYHQQKTHRTKSEGSIDSDRSTLTVTTTTAATTPRTTRVKSMMSPKPSTPSSTKRKALLKTESRILEDNEPIMQFGKATQTRYALDFKFPLSPLQAFGIALSSFAFETMNHNKQVDKQYRM